ncbi:hypothetical protein BDV30DRAFT_212329 [Aspergillus minisclerotigenes]|uniref:Uncharacterized protein n=1 Tax=Aspergillus minisclerotigenes TaxID=656917 RepID=A0A5N6J004_9EURO|nr:hypothetical protein BDV30DRAFT_212329 [Aspergillus minisclerotigenes]
MCGPFAQIFVIVHPTVACTFPEVVNRVNREDPDLLNLCCRIDPSTTWPNEVSTWPKIASRENVSEIYDALRSN